MPKPEPADEIHAALSSFSRNTIRADRISQEIADRGKALETAEDAITAAVLILTPLLERQPRDTAYRYLDTVYWLDPVEGICHRTLREWTDLLHQDDDEPDDKLECDNCHKTAVSCGSYYRCFHCGNSMKAVIVPAGPASVTSRDASGNVYISSVVEPIKPKSYAERMATEPYEPLTEAQIDEAALFKARKDEPSMPDSVLEAMAEAEESLIAAAHGQLAACERLLSTFESFDRITNPAILDDIKAAREAIAAVEGVAPSGA